jgi:hypothetical protein
MRHQNDVPENVNVMFVVAPWRLVAALLESRASTQRVSEPPAAKVRGDAAEPTRLLAKDVPVPLSAVPAHVVVGELPVVAESPVTFTVNAAPSPLASAFEAAAST